MKPDTSPRRPSWLARRLESAEYDLFCDDQANDHYGTPTTGLGYRIWRVRVFLRGFFAKLPQDF